MAQVVIIFLNSFINNKDNSKLTHKIKYNTNT